MLKAGFELYIYYAPSLKVKCMSTTYICFFNMRLNICNQRRNCKKQIAAVPLP